MSVEPSLSLYLAVLMQIDLKARSDELVVLPDCRLVQRGQDPRTYVLVTVGR